MRDSNVANAAKESIRGSFRTVCMISAHIDRPLWSKAVELIEFGP
jgi:hypothetical protein